MTKVVQKEKKGEEGEEVEEEFEEGTKDACVNSAGLDELTLHKYTSTMNEVQNKLNS